LSDGGVEVAQYIRADPLLLRGEMSNVAGTDESKAIEFEHYLKTGSGHAFANKRLW